MSEQKPLEWNDTVVQESLKQKDGKYFVALTFREPQVNALRPGNHVTVAYAGSKTRDEAYAIADGLKPLNEDGVISRLQMCPYPADQAEFGTLDVLALRFRLTGKGGEVETPLGLNALRKKYAAPEVLTEHPMWHPHVSLFDYNRHVMTDPATKFHLDAVKLFLSLPRELQTPPQRYVEVVRVTSSCG